MQTMERLDKIAINVKSHNLLKQLLSENPILDEILRNAVNETEVLEGVREWVLDSLYSSPQALAYYQGDSAGRKVFESLKWSEMAAIRILDYIDNAGLEVEDLNLRGDKAVSNPIVLLWLAVNRGTGGAKPYFFEDMLHLFRQFTGASKRRHITRKQLQKWMDRFPIGLDPRIVKLREENRNRLIVSIIERIDRGEKPDPKYKFEPNMTWDDKYEKVKEWWKDYKFHLRFAVRDPDLLNEMMGYSLDPDTVKIMKDAEDAGIPFFVNPYYLSLLYVRVPYFAIGGDLAMRDYVIYSRQLVEEFGSIVAWEKEDVAEPGKPNAAGWILPGHNIHRRYPKVAILIPDTVGRACGGLCSACQRMYGFQNGEFNFNLKKLEPNKTWGEKLESLMKYFEDDSQLRDILITGGDALMSSDRSLKRLLDAVYDMALRKKEKNKQRKPGEKYAEICRVRLGTKLPVYLPQRVTPELIEILADFKKTASKIGVKQFFIQTHFESPLEITPESRTAIQQLISAGWVITNQLVFTVAASRRGHTAKLRQVLNEIGVLTYYTFSVKGYMENYHHFATNSRAVQEQMEEKIFGRISSKHKDILRKFPENASEMMDNISSLKKTADLPFLSTDRNVLNLPGVGKSLTFRVVGITRYGRRILEFEHDATRVHSPIIKKMGKIILVESKSISEYLHQLEEIGEDRKDYEDLYGYSMGETEDRLPIYEYPEYGYQVTDKITNLDIGS